MYINVWGSVGWKRGSVVIASVCVQNGSLKINKSLMLNSMLVVWKGNKLPFVILKERDADVNIGKPSNRTLFISDTDFNIRITTIAGRISRECKCWPVSTERPFSELKKKSTQKKREEGKGGKDMQTHDHQKGQSGHQHPNHSSNLAGSQIHPA